MGVVLRVDNRGRVRYVHGTGDADSSRRILAERFANGSDRRPQAAAADHQVPGGAQSSTRQVALSEIDSPNDAKST